MGGAHGSVNKQLRQQGQKPPKRQRCGADDILNRPSPVKYTKNNPDPYGPLGEFWDKTKSVNYDPIKEQRLKLLKDRLM